MIRFSSPYLLLAAVPICLFLLWRLRQLPAQFGGRRRWIQIVSGAGAVALTCALGGFEAGLPVDRLAVVFAVDRSRSIEHATPLRRADGSGEVEDAIRESAREMEADDQAGIVVFGAESATESLPALGAPELTWTASVPREASDLGSAIRHSLSVLPEGYAGRIVVISDGSENRGDAIAAAQVAAGRGVAIDVVPLVREAENEVAVRAVQVPENVREGEPIEVRIVTEATQETEARVRVLRDGVPIAEAMANLREGSDVLVVRDDADEPGVHRYDVLVEPTAEGLDHGRTNNESGGFVRVAGGSRVLLAADEPELASALASAIEQGGMEVHRTDALGIPHETGRFLSYDLVVLSDLSARALSEEQMLAIRSYVRDLGGGLLMIGARRAFGLGGYAYTPIEDALPATFDLRQRRDRLSLAMIIAVDNSGSMGATVSGGRTKLDLANEAAARSAMLLSQRDRVGVMHVDTEVNWTQPMVTVTDPGAIAAAVRRAQPGGGGIYVDITLEASYQALNSERTQLKHMLLFSDGEDSEQIGGCRQQVRRAHQQGITTSVVSMGNGADTAELERLATLGGGRFYIVEDLRELPRIFTQETIEASRAALREEAFRATRRSNSPVLSGINFEESPILGGYSLVNARARSNVLLSASESDPLLTTWQYGLGRSAVFTTDAGSEFAQDWVPWDGYARLFSQLARDIVRNPESQDAQVHVSIENGVGRIRVDAIGQNGNYRNYLNLGGSVALPGGDHADVDLEQTGPGRYEATFDANRPGPYLVSVEQDERGLIGSAGTVSTSAVELSGAPSNPELLARLAAMTGGTVRPNLVDVFSTRPENQVQYVAIWRGLLIFALLSLFLSVALRRLVWPEKWRRRAQTETQLPVRGASIDALRSRREEKQRAEAQKRAERQKRSVPPRPAASQGRAPREPQRDATPAQKSGESKAAQAAPKSLAEQLLEKKKRN